LEALSLVEAGANHARAELRKRIRIGMKDRLLTVTQSSAISNYVTANNPLGFLRDYAYAPGETQFTILDNNRAVFSITPLSLDTAIPGSYAANIVVQANGAPTTWQGIESYTFYYTYTIDATGTVMGIGKNIALLGGTFEITVTRLNFAKYALFTFNHLTPDGTTVWFTSNTNFTGPVRTNQYFSFIGNPSGHFTEIVEQSNAAACYYNDRNGDGRGDPLFLDADYNSYINSQTQQEVFVDKPTFDKGFDRSQPAITLETSVSQSDLKKQALGGSLSNEPSSNGIYVIADSGMNITGGIYIKCQTSGRHYSDDDPTISMSVGSSGPLYEIKSGSTTKKISVNYGTNQTSVETVGTGTVTYNGVPDGASNSGIVIYSNDIITSFSGTVEGNSKVTVSSEKDIVITNNVKYQNYTPDNLATPANELSAINSTTGLPYTNVLGIISWGGNVRISNNAPSNINVHGIVMAPTGVFTVDNYDTIGDRGIANILGGVITNYYGAFGTFGGWRGATGYGRNFVYDSRMLEGRTPPYFPYISNFGCDDKNTLNGILTWQDKGG
jgi:hypothetical protein